MKDEPKTITIYVRLPKAQNTPKSSGPKREVWVAPVGYEDISIPVSIEDTFSSIKAKLLRITNAAMWTTCTLMHGATQLQDTDTIRGFNEKHGKIFRGEKGEIIYSTCIENDTILTGTIKVSWFQPPYKASMLGFAAGTVGCFGYRALTSSRPYFSHIKPTVICGICVASISAALVTANSYRSC